MFAEVVVAAVAGAEVNGAVVAVPHPTLARWGGAPGEADAIGADSVGAMEVGAEVVGAAIAGMEVGATTAGAEDGTMVAGADVVGAASAAVRRAPVGDCVASTNCWMDSAYGEQDRHRVTTAKRQARIGIPWRPA